MSSTTPVGWRAGRFGDLADVVNGYAFKSADFVEKTPSSLPVVRMSNMSSGILDLTDAVFVKGQLVQDLTQFRLEAGDFVFGMSGSVSNYAVVREQDGVCYQNQRVGRLRAKQASREFVAQLFRSEYIGRQISALAAGGAQVNISASQIENLDVLFPSLPEQKKIASILTSVDEVIENTQKQIDKLQDLKKATMNELLTKGFGHTEFKDSELGRIPKSWVVRPLDKLAKIQTGIAKSSKQIDEAVDVPYLRVANVQDGYLDLSEVKTIQVAKSKLERYLLKSGDVLMNEGGDFDKLGRGTVWQGEISGCVHQNHVFAVRTNRSLLDPQYLKYVASSEYGKKYFIQSSKQSTNLASINSTQLKEMPIPTAPVEEQAAIAKIMKGIEGMIEVRERKLSSFSDLKTALMQDLLTGKVRVSVD